MGKLEPPQAFSFGDNVSHSWKLWLKHYDFYLAATEKDTEGDKIKTSIFLTCIGQKGREIYETFTFEPGDEMKLAPVLHKFSEYCNPRKNITILRHKFFTYRQQEGQNFHDFVTELKKLSSECEFDNLQDSLIKDMIVCGTKDNSLRERLLRECDLTLSKAISAGHAAEETRKHAHKILRSQPTADIDKIFKKKLNNSSQNSRNQNTKDFMKKCKLKHAEANVQLMEKFVMFAIKRTVSKFATHVLVKKYMKLKRTNLMNPPTRAIMNFLLKLVIFRILHILTKSRMKTLIGQ